MPPRRKKTAAAALDLALVEAPADVAAPPAKRTCHEPKRPGMVTGAKLEAIHDAVDKLYDELYTFRGTPDDDAPYTEMWPVRDWEVEEAYIVLRRVEVEGCFHDGARGRRALHRQRQAQAAHRRGARQRLYPFESSLRRAREASLVFFRMRVISS